MDVQQLHLLADIQALAIAGGDQTGMNIWHYVRAGQGHYVCSEVHVLHPQTLETLHRTTAMINSQGWDRPTGIDDNERTLIQQRDELVEWIANNRRDAA
ncbi:hypothetical protein ACFQH5_20450 [Halomonas salifodinae]|uniref:Uncharacterized protein n=1 Tax=Halomonas salifodinae TaxID=438745 RepID=A0ABW2F4G9_9GAMM